MQPGPDDPGSLPGAARRSLFVRRLRELAWFLDPLLLVFGGLVAGYCYWVSTLVDGSGDMPARDAFLAAVAVAAFAIFATSAVVRRSAALEAAERYKARVKVAQEQGLDAWEVVSALEDAIDLQRRKYANGPAAGTVGHVLDVLGNEVLLAERVLSTTYRTYTLLGDEAPGDPRAPGAAVAAERSLLLRKQVRGLRDQVRRRRVDALVSREARPPRPPVERAPVASDPLELESWPLPSMVDLPEPGEPETQPATTETRTRAARGDGGEKRPAATRPRTRRG